MYDYKNQFQIFFFKLSFQALKCLILKADNGYAFLCNSCSNNRICGLVLTFWKKILNKNGLIQYIYICKNIANNAVAKGLDLGQM